ncbi:tetratricopeptide repeat protein [Micromonospora sp. NPDC002575]|uniref:tetratricopeptide repeat protein n=1 Tax=Micromonospora sp. NPDC002575 TaxID=3364222 RepID=UPI00368FEE3C
MDKHLAVRRRRGHGDRDADPGPGRQRLLRQGSGAVVDRPALAGAEDYQQALTRYQQAGNRGNEAATLSDTGLVYDGLGDRQRALDHYHRALPLQREVGDRVGEAVTRYNIAMVHQAGGHLDQAIEEIEHVVELNRQMGHPSLKASIAVLEQLRRQRAGGQEPT